uniref:Uncharacterized protein n=1 Tax=Mayetiola destructor TaxID=39758 RepID=F6KPQ7_MAYDE|nr:hypothetical protein [Mayetiola destructor]
MDSAILFGGSPNAVLISSCDKSIAMYSGLETNTEILNIAISARNESLNACKACLDAANVERNGIGTLPATLLMKTIFPVFR